MTSVATASTDAPSASSSLAAVSSLLWVRDAITTRAPAAAKASAAPVLLRNTAGIGHAPSSSVSGRIEELVDVYAFLFAQLGVKVRS